MSRYPGGLLLKEEHTHRRRDRVLKPTTRKEGEPSTFICSECGTSLESRRTDVKTCSNKCRTRRSKRIRKEAKEKVQ